MKPSRYITALNSLKVKKKGVKKQSEKENEAPKEEDVVSTVEKTVSPMQQQAKMVKNYQL